MRWNRYYAAYRIWCSTFRCACWEPVPDAEDATQEILIKIMTHLASFRQESSPVNLGHADRDKPLAEFSKRDVLSRSLSFETYGADIVSGKEKDIPDRSAGVERQLLEQELKYSCTNVMLQCLDAESRCIYILGTMFRLNSIIAAEILDTTPQAYRQKLSRIRKKMAQFLNGYCGLSGTGACSCARRVDYAIENHRIDPKNLVYNTMKQCNREDILRCAGAMEELDELSQIFAGLPAYRSAESTAGWIRKLVASDHFRTILHPKGETV